MQSSEEKLTGEQKLGVIKQVLLWASLLSVLLAFFNGDFQSEFNQIWGYYGAVITSLLSLDFLINSIAKIVEWMNQKKV